MLEARGVPVSDGQLVQLIEFGLLDVDGDVLRTAFPVLGRAETGALRRQVQPLGELLADRLAPPVVALRGCLDQMDLGGSTYAVVFGYALDGLVWDRLASRGAVPDTTLCAERPWWNGAFWAVYPPRDDAGGTNFVDCGDVTLVQVWTTTTVARLTALAAATGLPAAIRGLLDTGGTAPAGEVVDATGVTWPLRRPDGRPAIPVLGPDEPMDQFARQLADVVAEGIVGDEAASTRALVPCDDVRVATVILAHELIWSITEALVASGTVDLARSLTTPHTGKDVPVDLLFVQANQATSTPTR
jgi:hypothetical protein